MIDFNTLIKVCSILFKIIFAKNKAAFKRRFTQKIINYIRKFENNFPFTFAAPEDNFAKNDFFMV